MASARPVGPGFALRAPALAEEVALLPGRRTPHLHAGLVRLGTWMPFAQAAAVLQSFTRAWVSAATVRRQTEAAGAADGALQTAEVEHILHAVSPAPCPAERLVVSADGAMVPVRHSVWAEVKTLAISEGVASTPVGAPEQPTQALSYFARLADADTVGERATVETHRRGVHTARQVAAVGDGAAWLQRCFELQCPTAVRMLDFPHAAERVSQIGQMVFGADTPTRASWLAPQLHALKHTGPEVVVTTLQALKEEHPELPELAEHVTYLEKRLSQMQYPTYAAQGWPLGSGMVESANRLVVEARLKGAGMHWERDHVNPMLALRNIVCSDRWDEAWPQISRYLRQQDQAGHTARRQRRLGTTCATTRSATTTAARAPTPTLLPAPPERAARAGVAVPATSVDQRVPAADHPWRRAWSVRRQLQQVQTAECARL